MVNKVDGQKYYEYAKVNRQKRESTDSPEFHLNQEKQGVIYEKSPEKKKTSETGTKEETVSSAQSQQQGGVKLEISREGQEQAKQVGSSSAVLAGQIRELAQKAVTFLKGLWDKIWNEPSKEKEAEFPEVLAEHMEEAEKSSPEPEPHPLEKKDSLAWSIYTQEEIRAIFRRGDQKEIEDFLSQHGERHLAKNSDLLTQYDRRCSIVGIDRSDKELILHGNKNQIGL